MKTLLSPGPAPAESPSVPPAGGREPIAVPDSEPDAAQAATQTGHDPPRIRVASVEIEEPIADLLVDLEHDLGKYVRLPLAMLPSDASEADLLTALERALLQTRRTRTCTESAAEIWRRFQAKTHARLEVHAGYHGLTEAVERALGWTAELTRKPSAAPIDRPQLERDLGAVARAIRALIPEVGVE